VLGGASVHFINHGDFQDSSAKDANERLVAELGGSVHMNMLKGTTYSCAGAEVRC
jgi:hypothetical protein